METTTNLLRKVATVLRNWKGSDAGEEASPEKLAEEIDEVYAARVASLPAQTLAIRRGQEEWERRAG